MTTAAVRSTAAAIPAMVGVLAIGLGVWASSAPAQSQPGTSDNSDITAKINELASKGGSLDDVIRLLGEPRRYVWASETFTKDSLPKIYCAVYDNGLQAVIESGSLTEIRLERGPAEYRFAGELGIGSSLAEALAVLGQPVKTVRDEQVARFEDNVLYLNCSRGPGGRMSYYGRSQQGIGVFFADDKVIAIYLTPRQPAAVAQPAKAIETIQEYGDVRSKDLSKLDLRWRGDLVATLTFNQATVWPPPARMPLECDPCEILEHGKNPGLGVRKLHDQGITGKGVCVAIIDQPLFLDHPEFAGKIAAYHDVGCRTETSMHGPAVASLLVGTSCGTAPEATVYFVAAPSWAKDTAYQAKALDWIVEQNAKLHADRKIRLVSVSAAPSGRTTLFTKNTEMWDAACKQAEKAGLLVLDCTSHHGFISRCWYDPADPEDVSKCTAGAPGQPLRGRLGRLYVPASLRTTAEERSKGRCEYIYWGRGGLSWTVPYCAGVLAMGWQIRPEIPPEAMRGLLFRSASVKDRTTRIIDPQQFIRAVQAWGSPRSPRSAPARTAPSGAPSQPTEELDEP